MADHPTVMISSTARDLPEHRKQVQEACLRQSMFPVMMEHLPAADADAIAESLRMVDEAEIYLGIVAFRYGDVPTDHTTSISEMEYERAVERDIPRLIFLMHEEHPVKPTDVETGPGAEKLKAFKARLQKERVVAYFDSPADLRAKAIDSLSRYHQEDLTAFHYVRDIPAPPEPYIAHPYVLLQASGLIGRQRELNELTEWVTWPNSPLYGARILNMVAIGGMGKSALTWKWFNDIAPREIRPLAGRLWWSFYESDAHFENFVIRALAYVSRRPREDIEKNTKPGEREDMLLQILDREPFLLVLDGLERILIAYQRIDTANLSEDDLDERTTNLVANALRVLKSTAKIYVAQHRLRRTADPRVGAFLRKFAQIHSSRVLISTRLYPADLQIITGEPSPGTNAYFLDGLQDDDALNLWRAFGVMGSREALLRLFATFNNYPLLIRTLAGEVVRFRQAPNDFDQWRQAHPGFDPFELPLVQVQSHILTFALKGLDSEILKVLYTITAFHMPADYDTLNRLLVGDGKLFVDGSKLDSALTELEDRSLIGWERRSNHYDIHPVVRGVILNIMDDKTKFEIYEMLRIHFESLYTVIERNIANMEQIKPTIELYTTLVKLNRCEEALYVYIGNLINVLFYRLNAHKEQIDLLSMLFSNDLDNNISCLSEVEDQAYALICLAHSYMSLGLLKRAIILYRRHIQICGSKSESRNMNVGLCSLAWSLFISGSIFQSEVELRKALSLCREIADKSRKASSLALLGHILSARGAVTDATLALQQALSILKIEQEHDLEGLVDSYIAQMALWLIRPTNANYFATLAWEQIHLQSHQRMTIRILRLRGEAQLSLVNLQEAQNYLSDALTRARSIDLIEEELPILTALATVCCRQAELKNAKELLSDVWEVAERGPYPLLHADALNVLAQIERDAGNTQAAIAAATEAYTKAWCDGPPYVYHWGLEAAKAHLAALGAPEPQLPPFDESKYEPMPEVEIDPPDDAVV